jgi:sugar-specific transcriptional regulator TrmB
MPYQSGPRGGGQALNDTLSRHDQRTEKKRGPQGDRVKEPGYHDTIEQPADYYRILYRRHFQGALVRSAASVSMWLFALVAFLTNDIDSQSLKGVSLSVIYLISINPPALWLLKVISRHTRVYKYFSILINLLEIFGYTTIIYFLGGIESAYLTLMYAALITYVGSIAPRRIPFIIAALCSVMFSLVVIGEHFGVIPHQRIVSYSDIPWLSQQFRLAVVIGLLFVVAYISSYTASLLKKNRRRLQRQNLELMETTAILEETEKKLQSDQQSLEIRVRERSAALAKANEDLQAELTARKRAEEQLRQTLDSLRKAVSATIQVMVSAVERRDPYTAGHQIRSADLARAIATEMGLSPEKIEGIRMAGSIHDIGKLSIPAEILSKPTKLSEIEFSLIKEHARQGYEIFKNVESPWPLAEIVHQHH